MRGMWVGALLAALAALAAPAAAADLVEMACTVSVAADGGAAVVVSRPRISTPAGQPATIESQVGAGDGKPGHRIAVELVPRLEAGAVTLAATGALIRDDGGRVDGAGKGASVALHFDFDARTRYTVACEARPAGE